MVRQNVTVYTNRHCGVTRVCGGNCRKFSKHDKTANQMWSGYRGWWSRK